MKTAFLVLLPLLLATAVAPRASAAGGSPATAAWRSVVEAGLQLLTADADGSAARELGAREPDEAAPLIFEAAVRAELRLRFGTSLPRVKAELRQEFRVAARAGAAARDWLRALERVRRRFERAMPGGSGSAPALWWMGPGTGRGRRGS